MGGLSPLRAFGQRRCLSDQKGAPCHPGQDATRLHLCSLRQSLVRSVIVEADRSLLSIKSAYHTASILLMQNQRPSFETKGAGPPIGFPDSALCCLQAMQLAAVEHCWDDVPQSRTCRLFSPTDRRCQHPTIYRVRGEGLLALAVRLCEAVVFTQLLRLPALSGMDGQPHFAQESVQVLFSNLYRAKRGIPTASFSLVGLGAHIFNDGVGKRQDFAQLRHDPRFRLPPTAC